VENIGIMAKPIIRRYNSPASGWGALEATGKALADQGTALSSCPSWQLMFLTNGLSQQPGP
jgi:hypothetical protein